MKVNHPRYKFEKEYEAGKAWCQGQAMQEFLDIVLLLCPEGDEFSFALSAASLVDEEQAALMLMKEPCDVCKISEAAAFIAMA